MSKIAWAGELVLLEAKWTDKDGHTAKFRLATPNEERPNPFKIFTKRRSGRAGTRFFASMSLVDGLATDQKYDGEMMLAGWADTSTQGYTVTFWVEPPDEGLHPFQGYTRGVSSFMVGLVELDEDEQPIDQTQRSRVESANKEPSKPGGGSGRLSMYAAMLCNNPDFWEWANWANGNPEEGDPELVNSKEMAAQFLRGRLGIGSRSELDSDEKKAEAYHEQVRKPFVRWNEEKEAA